MCGIVGYIGPRPASYIVQEGLRQLEYRGYDSSGIALLDRHGVLHIRRATGKLNNLEGQLSQNPVNGRIAIGHTRWATHGLPSERNAHPHTSPDREIAVVHNGIVENYQELRDRLEEEGYRFLSETDTEVIAHLVHLHWKRGGATDIVRAVRFALRELQGPSAIVVLSRKEPMRLVAARLGNAGGVVVGYGDNEMFVASDIPAILNHTRKMAFLESREVVQIDPLGAVYMDLDGNPVQKNIVEIDWDHVAAEKGSYRHFMEKEIFEQEQSIANTLRGRLDQARNRVRLDALKLDAAKAQRLAKVTIVACGSSYYAGLVGKYYIERLARLPVEVDYSSEFRYRYPVVEPDHLVLAITQSGETVDTLAALEEARLHGAFTASIVNVIGSQAARVSDGVIPMQAGPEIGVATTKAFTASLVDLLLLAMDLGRARGAMNETTGAELVRALTALPELVRQVLDSAIDTSDYRKLADVLHSYQNFLYLGRGVNYPIALEGALKLKEISYIHAEGYPAGEMKHGPIALIDPNMPTVVIAARDSVYDKVVSQIEQVKARNGKVIAVTDTENECLGRKVDHLITIPKAHELVTPVLASLPMQLLAYEIAVRRGADVDQPRNLAKSVTVE